MFVYIAGKLRYKGPIFNRVGTHFGVELINARGKGNSNGTCNKHRYCAFFMLKPPVNMNARRSLYQRRLSFRRL